MCWRRRHVIFPGIPKGFQTQPAKAEHSRRNWLESGHIQALKRVTWQAVAFILFMEQTDRQLNLS